MKTLSKLLVVLTIVSAMFGCNKDEDKPNPNKIAGVESAEYLVKLDGEELVKGTVQYASRDVTADEGDNNLALLKDVKTGVMSIVGIPRSVGSTSKIDGDNISVLVMNVVVDGKKQSIYTVSGELKRDADNKVSFSGTINSSEHQISGYVVSDAIKAIK